MKSLFFILTIFLLDMSFAQRGHYSGMRTQGYKDKFVPKTDEQLAVQYQSNRPQTGNELISGSSGMPVNAHGDRQLVDRIRQMPRDKQPFWYINADILEAQRNAPFPVVQSQNTQGQGLVQNQPSNQGLMTNQDLGTQNQMMNTNLNNRGSDFGLGGTQFGFGHNSRSPFAGSSSFGR